MLYLFIDENTIQPYNGENLKRYVGDKLIQIIANPTEDELREFKYMNLVAMTEPEYDPETQYVKHTFSVKNDMIYETYEVMDAAIESGSSEDLTNASDSDASDTFTMTEDNNNE